VNLGLELELLADLGVLADQVAHLGGRLVGSRKRDETEALAGRVGDPVVALRELGQLRA
jgi:hypothetical protein